MFEELVNIFVQCLFTTGFSIDLGEADDDYLLTFRE